MCGEGEAEAREHGSVMSQLTAYPEQRVDSPAQLHGTDRLTRRFVSHSSAWAVEWFEQWDGARRLFIKLAVARPTANPMWANLVEHFGAVDWSLTNQMMSNERQLRDSIEDFCARVWRETREMDCSMAAYCASNLWC